MILKTDNIIAAFGQDAAGPGWGNSPLWIIVRDENQNIREECLQPKDQTPEMYLLYDISQNVNRAMVQAVVNWQEWKIKKRKKP